MSHKFLQKRSKPGFVNHPLYKILMAAVHTTVKGAFIELGVYKGATFQHIYNKALVLGRKPIAVDSFIGMQKPINEKEEKKFPEGAFGDADVDKFKLTYPNAVVYQGFVPGILKLIHEDAFAFAHLDLDHEKPTRETLDWIWPRMSQFGILICHDFNTVDNCCAPKAIREWMKDENLDYIGFCDHSIFFQKGIS